MVFVYKDVEAGLSLLQLSSKSVGGGKNRGAKYPFSISECMMVGPLCRNYTGGEGEREGKKYLGTFGRLTLQSGQTGFGEVSSEAGD